MLMKSLDTAIIVQRNWGAWGVTVIRGGTVTAVETAIKDNEMDRNVTMMAMHTRRLVRMRIIVPGVRRRLRT
jgi:hypothetical protein